MATPASTARPAYIAAKSKNAKKPHAGLATRQKTFSRLWQEGNKLTVKGGPMEMMHWYNPLTMEEEEVSAPMSDAQAIEILSGHRDSDRFIEEYRRRRAM